MHATTLLKIPTGIRAARQARQLEAPGGDFDRFGRRLGLKLAARGEASGLQLLAAPVSIVRYWEFPFVWRWLPDHFVTALDVASPRLFSLRVATTDPSSQVTMVNPDAEDAAATRRVARVLGLSNLDVHTESVFAASERVHDCAWAISVIEHIQEAQRPASDTDALVAMANRIRSGGRIIITVPTRPRFSEEYRDHDEYGLGTPDASGQYFFQRWYDEVAIHDRLVRGSGLTPLAIEWFGECEAGSYEQYRVEWQRDGIRRTVFDPMEIATRYRPYRRFRDMPGMGVCGICFRVP